MASEPDAATLAPEEEKPKLALQVKVDKTSACERHVTVTVERDDIDRYYKEAFDELQPKAEVPGFRPGRAPRRLIESRFREQMADQVKGSLLMDSVTQASEECDFSAISEPDFDFEAIELPDEGPMTFEFNIEVRPEFDMPEWKGLKLNRPVHEYTNEEVDEHLESLLARYGRLIDKEGAAEVGDHVSLKITFKREDDVLSEVENSTVEIKPKLSFRDGTVEGFDELMLGASVGDQRQTKVKISDEAEEEELRGQDVDAELEIRGVKQLELPELNSNFLDRIGGFTSEEDLRETVREELERRISYHQSQQIRKQITAQLTAGADWDLPPDMLRRQARRELERAMLELRSSGFSDADIRAHTNQLRQTSVASTERALKEHFIFERLAEDHEIDAEQHEFDAEIRSIAKQSQESSRRVRARLEKRGQMDALRNQIIERKVVEVIMEEADITDTELEQSPDDTAAIEHAIGGKEESTTIPEAKYGGDAEELKGPAERG